MKALFFALVAATLVIFNCTLGESAPKEGLVLYFAFNEGTGKTAKDLSENGNDGEIHDAKWVDGKFGKALEFDGKTGYVEVPDSKSLDITKAVTIEAWVKSNADHPGYTGLVRKGNPNGDRPNNYMLQIKPDGPGGADLIQLVYAHASNNNEWTNSVTVLEVDKWYYLVGVINPP